MSDHNAYSSTATALTTIHTNIATPDMLFSNQPATTVTTITTATTAIATIATPATKDSDTYHHTLTY